MHDETCTMVRDGAGRLEKVKRERAWKEKKKVRVTMEGRVYATACMQINAFLYLPNSQYARLHPTYLATGGTVKSENVSTTLLPIADNFVTRVFRIFVSFG